MATYNSIVAGLTILAKYDPKGMDSHGFAAEHDEIFACSVAPDAISEEDRANLAKLGWRWDEDVDSWAKFV
jgi:hypothetical protein